MSKFDYSEIEKEFNDVLKYHSTELSNIEQLDRNILEDAIRKSEELLEELKFDTLSLEKNTTQIVKDEKKCLKENNEFETKYSKEDGQLPKQDITFQNVATSKQLNSKINIVSQNFNWQEIHEEAVTAVGSNNTLESLFSAEELASNSRIIQEINEEFKQLYKLDKIDLAISSIAGIIASAIDIFLVGIPQKTNLGLKAGTLSNYIRKYLDEIVPKDDLNNLFKSIHDTVSESDVGTNEGASLGENLSSASESSNISSSFENTSFSSVTTFYQRLYKVAKAPIIGIVSGICDAISGKMSAMEKYGNVFDVLTNTEKLTPDSDLFKEIALQLSSFNADEFSISRLPAPFMEVFNLLHIGNIGEQKLTIAEIVQEMYQEGYDLSHYCAMSIPTLMIEVMVRTCYTIKRLKEGQSLKKALAFSTDRRKNHKLATMLFLAHSVATASNIGKITFTNNPLAINYTEMLAFAKYSYCEFRWWLVEKNKYQMEFIDNKNNEELFRIYQMIDDMYDFI